MRLSTFSALRRDLEHLHMTDICTWLQWLTLQICLLLSCSDDCCIFVQVWLLWFGSGTVAVVGFRRLLLLCSDIAAVVVFRYSCCVLFTYGCSGSIHIWLLWFCKGMNYYHASVDYDNLIWRVGGVLYFNKAILTFLSPVQQYKWTKILFRHIFQR